MHQEAEPWTPLEGRSDAFYDIWEVHREAPTAWVSEADRSRSSTAHMLPYLEDALAPLRGMELSRLLDIGCGFGGLACFTSTVLGIQEKHGVDRDEHALDEARQKGLVTVAMEIGKEALPYPDGAFDLITCFGMLDYLPDFDPAIEEILRVTRPGGHVLVSLPNLASWHNRLALLLGYQPRDVEVSQRFLAGAHPHYRRQNGTPVGHIHVPTTHAFRELMEAHGFKTLRVSGGAPALQNSSRVVHWIDCLLTRRAGLARRFFYLGCRPGDPTAVEAASQELCPHAEGSESEHRKSKAKNEEHG